MDIKEISLNKSLLNLKYKALLYKRRRWFSLIIFLANVVIAYIFHNLNFTLVILGISVTSIIDIFFREILAKSKLRGDLIKYPISFEFGGWAILIVSLFVNIYMIFSSPNPYVLVVIGFVICGVLSILAIDNEN